MHFAFSSATREVFVFLFVPHIGCGISLAPERTVPMLIQRQEDVVSGDLRALNFILNNRASRAQGEQLLVDAASPWRKDCYG